MYRLLNENQNKNALKDEYETLLLNTSSERKISKEESSLLLYEDFNKDIIKYIITNIMKMDELSKNQKNKIDLNLYLKAFIDKLFNLLEMNIIITNNFEFCSLIYFNITQLITEGNKEYKFCYILFFKIYLSYLTDNKDNYIYYKDKINKIGQFIKQLNTNIQSNYNDFDNPNILYNKLYISFTLDFLPIFIKNFIEISIKNNSNICLFELINNFLFCYENLIHEISVKYFYSYDEINWRKKYIQTLCNIFYECVVKNGKHEFNDNDIDKIYEIIKQKNYNRLNKIQSLLYFHKILFQNYLNTLIKSLEKYLTEGIENEEDYYSKIELIYKIEKELLNINNINFFYNDKNIDIKTIYHKLIFHIFCKDKNNSVNEILVKSFNSIIRKTDNENEIKIKSNILFKYIDIIPDYENFESLYIHSIIDRILEDVYDYIKEKQFIDDIIAFSTSISHYSYRLQTLINNIKRKNVGNISITIIPSHCYYLYNLYCKPNLCPKLLNNFNTIIINELKLSENIKPIFQQGSIIFNINSPKLINFQNIYIKSDILQYTILKYIGIEKGKKFEEIKADINLSDDLGRFILNEMIKSNLIIYNDLNDNYSLNKGFKLMKKNIDVNISTTLKDEEEIDIRINYKNFFEGKLDFNINTYQKKIGIKHQRMIIQCYIMKFLKMNKEKKNNDFNFIMEYLQKNLPLIGKMNLDNDELNENLKILSEKLFITCTTNKNKEVFYHYS